jgi:hypothetical protein
MNVQPWILVGFAALVGIHGLAVVYASRRSARATPTDGGGVAAGDREGTDGEPLAGGGDLACPECGTANDAAFRYCRDCVATLPGNVRLGDGGPRADPDPPGGY